MRWGIEVTFEEARAHLGLETQRQWSDLAIVRTTLLGLFSFIILLAHRLTLDVPLPVRSAAWYTKSEATFSDVIMFVRRYLWTHSEFVKSQVQPGPVPISAPVLHGLIDVLCYAT